MHRRRSIYIGVALGALVALFIGGNAVAPVAAAAPSTPTPPRPLRLLLLRTTEEQAATPAATATRRALHQAPETAAAAIPTNTPLPPLPPPSADDVPWRWASWRTWVSLLITAANAFTAAATGQGGAPIIVAVATGVLLFTVADAAAFSAAVLAAGALPALAHALTAEHPLFPGSRPLVDWRLIALTTPPMLCGVMIGAVANESFPPWLLSLLMVLLFSGAAIDMALSYARLLRRERERDALLKRLEEHVAQEDDEAEQERRASEELAAAQAAKADEAAKASATCAVAADPSSPTADKAAAFGLGTRRASLESSPSMRSTGTVGTLMAPGDLKADLDRLRLLTREIARGEAQALNPALLGRTLDGELEAAFEAQRRTAVAAAAHQQERLQLRRSMGGGRPGASSLDPERSLGLVLEEDEEGAEESSGGGADGGEAATPRASGATARAAAAAATTTIVPASTTPPGTPSLAAAAAAAATSSADAAAADFLARRVVAVKREHDERVAWARTARVREAALDDARYHAAVDGRLRSGRRGSALRAESRLADLRSARSASNMNFAGGGGGSSALFSALGRGGGGGGGGSGRGPSGLMAGQTAGTNTPSFSTRIGALRSSVGAGVGSEVVGSGAGGGVGSGTRGAGSSAVSLSRFGGGGGVDPRSGPSAAISAPSDSRERAPSFGGGAASNASVTAAAPRPPSFGGGGGGGSARPSAAAASVSPFAAFSAGGGSGAAAAGGGRAGSLLSTGGSGFGPRSAHSDVLAVSPWVLMQQREREEREAKEKEEDADDGRAKAGDQGPPPPPPLPPSKATALAAPAPADADRTTSRDQSQKKKKAVKARIDDDDDDDGRVGAFIVEDDADGPTCACLRPLADRAAELWAARARAARAWWELLPGAEAAVTAATFALFICYEALDKGLFANHACAMGSLVLRLVFVALMLAVTAGTVWFLVSTDKKKNKKKTRVGAAAVEAGQGEDDHDKDDKGDKDDKDQQHQQRELSSSPQLPPGAELGRHEAAVAWSPALVAVALPLALLIGAIGGTIGASGVVVSSALLLRLGGHPQVVAASSKLTLFTSVSATTVSLALAGRLNVPYAAAHGLVTLLVTPLGQWCADGLIRRMGRPSLIVVTNALRFAAGVAAIVGVSLVPALLALRRGDPSAQFQPVCREGVVLA